MDVVFLNKFIDLQSNDAFNDSRYTAEELIGRELIKLLRFGNRTHNRFFPWFRKLTEFNYGIRRFRIIINAI